MGGPGPLGWSEMMGGPGPLGWSEVVGGLGPLGWSEMMGGPGPLGWSEVMGGPGPLGQGFSTGGQWTTFFYSMEQCINDLVTFDDASMLSVTGKSEVKKFHRKGNKNLKKGKCTRLPD